MNHAVVLKPDQALAALVGRVLVADAADREGGGYRFEGGFGDGDADHSGLAATQRSISSLPIT
jgi:hypothetical protein